jgi:hypothetical protein
LISATARGLTKKRRYLIAASEVERAKREGNFEGKAMPALINA